MTRTCAKVNNVLWDQLHVHFLPLTGFIPDSLKHFLFVHELLSRDRDAIPPEYLHILNNHIFMQKVTLTDWMSSESFTHMRSRMRCRREKMISGFLSPSSPAVSDSNRQSCLVSVFTSNKTREGGGGMIFVTPKASLRRAGRVLQNACHSAPKPSTQFSVAVTVRLQPLEPVRNNSQKKKKREREREWYRHVSSVNGERRTFSRSWNRSSFFVTRAIISMRTNSACHGSLSKFMCFRSLPRCLTFILPEK